MEIQDKTVIVTGGASGIGRATSEAFVRRGARVVIFDASKDAGSTAARVWGEEYAHFVRVDVSDAEQVEGGVEAAVERFGGVHVVVNAAGVPDTATTVTRDGTPFPLEIWNKVVGVNLTGSFNVARFAARAMLKNEPEGESGERGVILNVSSGAATQGQKGQLAYAASKAGVIGMVLPMARDLAAHGIRVVAIAPGLFDTAMVAGLPEKVLDGLRHIPLFPKRMGSPQEFGALACGVVEIPYLNATCIDLDAGARMT